MADDQPQTTEGKSLERHFQDWESEIFGYGYGTGERHVVTALKLFLEACPDMGRYDYEQLERAVTPPVAWLLINVLGKANLIEYGSSPRYGWLDDPGKSLRAFVRERTVDQLCEILSYDCGDADLCTPAFCNCGPTGFVEGAKLCHNPFWHEKTQ